MAITAPDKPKMYTYFIGIDISRNELDFAIQRGSTYLYHKEIPNDKNAITQLIHEFKALPKFVMSKAVFCMESTGIYCNIVLGVLKKFKTNIVQDNPLQIRKSLGNIRGKHDKADAIRIANYAYRHRDELRLWMPRRQIVQQLADFASLRQRLLGMQVALKNPLKEQQDFLKKSAATETSKLCEGTLNSLANDIAILEMRIAELIANDEYLNRLYAVITSVTCIGMVTAIQMIIHTNEFKDITSGKKFACYAGVAPFKNESGILMQRARVSHIANKRMKSLLHICSIGAIRYDKGIKEYYDRKIAAGKPRMSVLNAVRGKLIHRVFTCVNQNRFYQKDSPKTAAGANDLPLYGKITEGVELRPVSG